MKHKLLCLLSAFFLFAQSAYSQQLVMPLSPNASPLFGKDIVIHDKSYQNQRCEAICSAFNGWLYAIFSHSNQDSTSSFSILKSTDNGINWSVLTDYWDMFSYHPISFNIVVCGTDSLNLKVFISYVMKWNNSKRTDFGVYGYDGLTGNWLGYNLAGGGQEYTQYSNCSIASDYKLPANISSPYSIGVLYTRSSILNYYPDSLIYLSSSDGGATINYRKVVAVAKDLSYKFGKVALSYGYSPSWNSGRYFAAWEEKDSVNASVGHIFTSHTDPSINSPYTNPVCLDSIDATAIKLCRNPRISCQVCNTDNDSSNLTQVVLFEKYLPGSGSYDLAGCYNLRAASSNNFRKLNVSVTTDNEIQPYIEFNSFDNNFYVTYYDSTLQKLPMVKNQLNLTDPDSWNVISNGYNDSGNLSAPNPMIAVNPNEQNCASLWIADRENGNGVAMFDAQYSTYTDVPKISQNDIVTLFCVTPNPCSYNTSVQFELNRRENVSIEIYNKLGQSLKTIPSSTYEPGKHNMKVDISDIPPGSYYFSFRTSCSSNGGKIIVLR
ncbi:MAG: T9SS type A sorting domain-containing protein [Bacteroidetes bacterium]|nr:T9SS type A sorting domain-containing protein [Bacteroidota bacterium]